MLNQKQQKEKKTTKARKYILTLSDVDVEVLAKKAGQYNLTPAELLENFIRDFVGGVGSNGSDESDYVNGWADRCWFSSEIEKNLITFLCGTSWFSVTKVLESVESIRSLKQAREAVQEEIQHPKKNWSDYITVLYDRNTKSSIGKPTYSSREEYLAALEDELADCQEYLAYEEEQLEEWKKAFADYMGEKPYTWEEELEKLVKWHKASIPEPDQV